MRPQKIIFVRYLDCLTTVGVAHVTGYSGGPVGNILSEPIQVLFISTSSLFPVPIR